MFLHKSFLHAIRTFFALILITIFGISCTLGKPPKVAITQITSHESLDKVYNGIVDHLKSVGYTEKNITFSNAQGDISTAVQIATRFASMQPNVIVAIATPSAQAVVNAVKKSKIPVVFATVTDPIDAKLVKDLQNPGGNVTGTRNVTPVEKQVELMINSIPDVQRVGVVINHSETNSIVQLEDFKAGCKRRGIEVVTAEANDSAMVSAAAASIAHKVDCFYLLQDNTVASALPGLLSIANNSKVPVISSFPEAVKKGALLSLAVDEYDIGIQTGKIVERILSGKAPGDISVEDPQKLELAINQEAMKSLGIQFAKPLLEEADHLY